MSAAEVGETEGGARDDEAGPVGSVAGVTPPRRGTPGRGDALEWLAGLALLVALGWIALRSLDAASPVPLGDESLHLTRVLDLERGLRHTRSAWERAAMWVFSGDAYPNGLYAPSLGFVLAEHTVRSARTTLVAYALVHAAIALVLGRRLWGAPGAFAYAALVVASPVALAWARIYVLDVPLLAAVGVATLAAEASEGFRRPGPTGVFLVAAVVGLYVKWTFFLFCFVPILLAVARSLLGARRGYLWAPWLAIQAGMGVYAIVRAGAAWEGRNVAADALWIVLGFAALGVVWGVVAGLWAWRAAKAGSGAGVGGPPGPLNLSVAMAVVAGVAGPWYAQVWGSLWGRYAHEQRMYGARASTAVDVGIETVRLLLPLGEGLVVLGLLLALVTRRGRLAWLARIVGGAGAMAVIIEGLPADPRYLLPLVAVGAGAVVAGWPRGWAGWGLNVGIAGLLWMCAVGPLAGRDPGWPLRRGDPPAMAISARTLGSVPVPVLASSPSPATEAEIDAIVAALRRACPRTCTFAWTTLGAGGQRITGREVQAMGRWAGLQIEVHDVDEGQGLPGALRGMTICPPMTTIRPDPGAAGWSEGTWRSGPLSGGCRMAIFGG